MKRLQWWMRIVGGFYVLLGLGFVPFINEARLPFMIPAFAATPDTVEFKALIDWMFTFGLDLLVTGGVLVYAARDPLRHSILVQLLIALEVVRGVLDDIYYVSRGYAPAGFYVGFVAVHLIIIVTGVVLLRQATAEARRLETA